jgi:DNA repair protein RadD
MKFRSYQDEGSREIRAAWAAGHRAVLYVLPTGGGKTVMFCRELADHKGASCAIAHRRELVGQMSLTLARNAIRHRVIAPASAIRDYVALHMKELGRSWFDPNSECAVAGVDTITRRDLGAWAERVSLVVCDEGHHLLRANKWGKALELFPRARVLGVTATPLRADGRGLGRHADGVMDTMIVGPPMRALIEQGFLTDYRIFAPQSDIDLAHVAVSDATGDFNPKQLHDAAVKSHITGDIVSSYLKIAPGKLGVTFTVGVDLAMEIAARFREAGVSAECVTAETPDLVRAEILRRFKQGEVKQLVNVDLFGEGFDLPAIEVVSMGRPTESYGLLCQQFGRALRPMPGKDRAIIIDHVGNIMRHAARRGLPDAFQDWTLDRRERRGKSDQGPATIRVCPECTGVYERVFRVCPYCGHVIEPQSRTAVEHVDGDLLELDPAVLARLRGEAARVFDPPTVPLHADWAVMKGIHNRHQRRVDAQMALRATIAWWAGWQRSLGRGDGESYRRFWLMFGIDVATAQTLKRAEADALGEKIMAEMTKAGVVFEERNAA